MVIEPVPMLHNFMAGFFMWIVLAGFLVLPTTFPNIIKSKVESSAELSKALKIVRNVPLYVLSFSLACLL
jgi:hypothetical protein